MGAAALSGLQLAAQTGSTARRYGPCSTSDRVDAEVQEAEAAPGVHCAPAPRQLPLQLVALQVSAGRGQGAAGGRCNAAREAGWRSAESWQRTVEFSDKSPSCPPNRLQLQCCAKCSQLLQATHDPGPPPGSRHRALKRVVLQRQNLEAGEGANKAPLWRQAAVQPVVEQAPAGRGHRWRVRRAADAEDAHARGGCWTLSASQLKCMHACSSSNVCPLRLTQGQHSQDKQVG